jgi:hemoglobin-like flavoprotein
MNREQFEITQSLFLRIFPNHSNLGITPYEYDGLVKKLEKTKHEYLPEKAQRLERYDKAYKYLIDKEVTRNTPDLDSIKTALKIASGMNDI